MLISKVKKYIKEQTILPVAFSLSLLLTSIILGGFYYSAQIKAQKNIERAQEYENSEEHEMWQTELQQILEEVE